MTMDEQPVLSVYTLNEYARDLLENTFMPLKVRGEIGTLSCQQRTKHVYLTLKDARAQIRCVFFSGADRVRALDLKVGTQVDVFGTISLYIPNGDFQFKIQSIAPVGLGSLQQQFEALKRKLFDEGLCAQERKRPLPELLFDIGIVTSPDCAALEDFLHVALQRFPGLHIRIYPAAVQGKTAAKTLTEGVRYFNALPVEKRPQALLLTRGGGSIEDLWPFNDENLARAVAASEIPTVSAIGHEIDFSICDFVADVRAPTPTGAATLMITPLHEHLAHLAELQKNLAQATRLTFEKAARLFARVEKVHATQNPKQLIELYAQKVDYAAAAFEQTFRQLITNRTQHVERLENQLRALNPTAILNRGFALLRTENGTLIRSVNDVKSGEKVTAGVVDGTLALTVD